jgi:DNA-binding MarR family transcriptional regulator
VRRITDQQRRALLGARHLLSRRGETVAEVADAVLALHATDPATVFLSVFARLRNPSVAAVETALYDDQTLRRMLAMRRTMFVVAADVAPVVWTSTGRAVAARERAGFVRFLAEAGYSEQWLSRVEKSTIAALAERGEATAADLGSDVSELREQVAVAVGKPYAATQSIGTRLLRVLAAEGLIRRSRPRGGWTSSQFRWAAAEPYDDVPDAKAALVRRWLDRYGPATAADVKWWTGWTLTDVRKALADTEAVQLEDGSTAFAPPDLAVPDVEPWAALLPALDPAPMGWQERSWYLPADRSELFDRSGNIGPTVWWSGRVVGGWAQRSDGSLAWEPLADLPRAAVKAVAAEIDRLTALLGDVRVTPRFRTPMERRLSS